jgi:hypothetical protein
MIKNKSLFLYIITAFAISVWPFTLKSQNLICSIPGSSNCPGPLVLPVLVQNADSVGSISLKMNIDTMVLHYEGYQNIHPALQTGMLLINKSNSQIIMSWFSLQPANFGNTSLVELKFYYHSADSTYVAWDDSVAGNCVFTNVEGNEIPATFEDGLILGLMTGPVRSFPLNHGTFIDINPTLFWYTTGCQAVYDVDLSTDSTFASGIIQASALNSGSWAPGVLLYDTSYFWRIRARNTTDTLAWSSIWKFTTKSPDGIPEQEMTHFHVSAFPNPCRSIVSLKIDLMTPGELEISVNDITGRMVQMIHSGYQKKGEYLFPFDTGKLQQGNYICSFRFQSCGHDYRKHLMLDLVP